MIDNKGLVLGIALIVLLVAFNLAPTGPDTVDNPTPEGSSEATEPPRSNAGGDDSADSSGSTDGGEPVDDESADGGNSGDGGEPTNSAEQRDSDGDGLLDSAERATSGLHADADPMRYDVFVEIDYHGVEDPATIRERLEPVVKQFEQAPIKNPDGSTGIDLHLVFDDRIPVEGGLYGKGDRIRLDTSERDYYDAGYHYAIIDRSQTLDVTTGLGNWGKLAVVAPPRYNNEIIDVFMHELGHSLGIKSDKYRGIDSREVPSEKYTSVMNYDYTSGPGDPPQYNDGDPFDDWELIADSYTPGRGGGGCPTGESYCPTASTPADVQATPTP